MNLSFLIPYELVPWQWVVWICMGLFVGLTKAGFNGLTAVLIPLMAVSFGARESTGLLLPLLCFADILAVLYYRKHAEWKYILKLMPWTLAGFGAALFIDSIIPAQAFRYLMGGCLLAGLLVMFWNGRREQDKEPPSVWWFSAIFGMAGGFASVIGNVAGPIMAVFLLSMKLPKNSFVGTAAWFFLIVNYAKLPIQIFIWGTINATSIMFSITLLPVVVIGTFLGFFLIKKISEPVFRKVIMALTLISTIMLFI